MNHYLREDNSFSQRREHSLSAKRKQYLRGEKNYSPYKLGRRTRNIYGYLFSILRNSIC